MTGGASLDGLNGTQKAAMFMLAAGEEHAGRLLTKLDLEEIRDTTQAMSRLGRVSGDTVEALLNDFLERQGGTAGLVGLVGGYHAARRLRLGRGAVVELDRKLGESIDILVDNRLGVRGEVVILDDRLGVTMTEIIKTEP